MKYLYAYRVISIPSNIITILCLVQVWPGPPLSVLATLFWLKLITTILLILYIHIFRPGILFFFMNLGFGRRQFYASMLCIDLALYLLLFTVINVIR